MREVSIVQVAGFGAIGDNIYRAHDPAAALANLPGVAMYEVHPHARYRDDAALSADILVLTMTFDVEVFRLIHQRRLLGRPTICEINDFLPDVQAWNPAAASWADPRALTLFEALIRSCDATQVTSNALAERIKPWAKQVVVFPNQLSSVQLNKLVDRSPLSGVASKSMVVGWGGSAGHLQDLHSVAPALVNWLKRTPEAKLCIMGDPVMASLFVDVPSAQFEFQMAGSLAQYLDWLNQLDIGLAPMLPTNYNRCRSDVKFLEYASRGVVPVLQRLEPYADVIHGETGLLFDDPAGMVACLDQLMSDEPLRLRLSRSAQAQVLKERRIEQHIQHRLDFYLQQCNLSQQAADQLSGEVVTDLLRTRSRQPLKCLPGCQKLTDQHFRLDLNTAVDHHRVAGVQAMQSRQWAQARSAFEAAVQSDPEDAHAWSFLGLVYMQETKWQQAKQAFERAIAADPLCSRPVRGMARWHQKMADHFLQQSRQLNPIAADSFESAVS
jgi:tetratricopeptide (TPR) repeat protein